MFLCLALALPLAAADDPPFPAPSEGFVVGEPDTPSVTLRSVLDQFGSATDRSLLISNVASNALEQIDCSSLAGVEVPAGQVHTFVGDLLHWNGFVLSDVRSQAPRIFGVHSLASDDGSNARYTAVPAESLGRYEPHSALLVETSVRSTKVDSRQFSTSLRGFLPPSWSFSAMAAQSAADAEDGGSTLIVRGSAYEVGRVLALYEELTGEPIRGEEQGSLDTGEEAPRLAGPDSAREAVELLFERIATLGEDVDRLELRSIEAHATPSRRAGDGDVTLTLSASGRGADSVEALHPLVELQRRLSDSPYVVGAELGRTITEEIQAGGPVEVSAPKMEFQLDFVDRPLAVLPEDAQHPQTTIRRAAEAEPWPIGDVSISTGKRASRAGAPHDLVYSIRPSDKAELFSMTQVRQFLALLEEGDEPFVAVSVAMERSEDACGHPLAESEGWTLRTSVLRSGATASE